MCEVGGTTSNESGSERMQARQCPAEQVHSQDIFYFHIEYAEFQEILVMYDDRSNKYGSCL